MNRKIYLVMVILVIFGTAAFLAADPAEGYWKSIDDETGKATAFWNIYVRGGQLFGEIVKITDKPDDTIADKVDPSYSGFPISGDLSKRTVLHTPWIYNMSRRSEGDWRGGYIIDPNDGRRYRSDVKFHKADGNKYQVDTLEVKGKILFFSRSQYWERSSLAEVQAFSN